MEQPQLFTIMVYTEDQVGLLNQITIIFTRRGLNIESLTGSPSSVPGINTFTITCRSVRKELEIVIGQIQKRVDVLKAFLLTEEELVSREVALFKVSTERMLKQKDIDVILHRNDARILEITRDYTIIEKTGHGDAIQKLHDELCDYEVLQFVRSGRVAVTKSAIESMSLHLREQEMRKNN